MQCRESQSLAGLVRAVSETSTREYRAGLKNGFAELNEVQQNIARIKHWFTRGLGDLEGVFAEFSAVVARGRYLFTLGIDNERGELCLSYQTGGQDVQLGASQLNDMVNRLSFV